MGGGERYVKENLQVGSKRSQSSHQLMVVMPAFASKARTVGSLKSFGEATILAKSPWDTLKKL